MECVLKCEICGQDFKSKRKGCIYCPECWRNVYRTAANLKKKKDKSSGATPPPPYGGPPPLTGETEKSQRRRFISPTIGNKVNTSQCKSCLYSAGREHMLNGINCSFIELTGQRRPCEPSPNCTVYKKYNEADRRKLLYAGAYKEGTSY